MDDTNLKHGEVVVAYLVRHGETDDNANDVYKSNSSPMNSNGIKQVLKAKNFLKDREIGQAFTDDTARTVKSANMILEGRNKPVEMDQRLRNFDVGDAIGQKKSKFADVSRKVRQDKNETFPGSHESLNQFDARTKKPLLKILREGLQDGKPALLVTHDSVMHSLGRLLHNNSKSALVKPGGVVRVIWDGERFKSQPVFGSREKNDKEVS